MAAATGITSTVEDMAKFVSAQFRKGKMGGRQILSTGSLARDAPRPHAREQLDQGNAIGFAVRRERDKIYVSHGGSYPGYQTNTLLQLDGKVGVIVLTNADDSNPGGIATQLMNTVGEAVAKAQSAPAAETDVGSVVVAIRGTVSRPRRRVPGGGDESAAGDHQPQRRES